MVYIGSDGKIIDAVPMRLDVSDCGVAILDKKLAKIALLCKVRWVAHPKNGSKQLMLLMRPLHCCEERCDMCLVENMTPEFHIPNRIFCAKRRGHRGSLHVCHECIDQSQSKPYARVAARVAIQRCLTSVLARKISTSWHTNNKSLRLGETLDHWLW